MTHHILVIEYEPRYIQRIEEAAAGSGLSTTIARTGDEAIQALPRGRYDLIVLSTIIPRYSTAQLIRSIRNDTTNSSVPVLLTTSGYSGTDPRSDAMKIGASDMLIKPYAPPDFIQKVRSVLNLPDAASAVDEEPTAETVRLSSKQIFGDLLDESHPAPRTVEQPVSEGPEETVKIPKATPPPTSSSEPDSESVDEKRKRTASDDVDRMLADTLAGVRLPSPKKKKKSTASEDLDKLLENTLSGLESGRTREAKSPPVPPAAKESPTPDRVEPRREEPEVAAGEIEEEPFPDIDDQQVADAAADPEPDEPPFEGVGERSGEGSGTTLIREEEELVEELPEPTEPGPPDDSGHFGQYVLLEKIATGGMAEVWKARMRGLEGFEKIVAIKKILPHLSDNSEFIDMFVDEAKLAAQLSHNNIIHIYDLGKIDGSWFIAMEYNDGYDLKSLISKGKSTERPLPIPLSLFIASKIASALDYAHRKRGFDDQELGVVHRDVSPQNVLISREGDIKICDFGIAKAASKASHTQAGALKGKLQYMSPEQAWGRHVDHRSDIFATAAVLFEMLTGRKLFAGDSELSVLDQVREARVPSPSTYNPDVSSEIDEIVAKGLEKDPSGRFATAGEMARAIDAILSNYKPAPASSDLARYIAAIEKPESVSMPAMPLLQQSEASERSAAKDLNRTAAAEVVPPVVVPAPIPIASPEPPTLADRGEETLAVGAQPAATGDETIAITDASRTFEAPLVEDEEPAGTTAPFASAIQSDEPRRRSRVLPIAIVLIIIAAVVAGGAVMMMRGGSDDGGPETDAAAALGANTVAPVPQPQEPSPDDVITQQALDEEQLIASDSTPDGEPVALGDDDMAMIEQAVRDRIEAERLRLEAQNRQTTPSRQPERRESPAETRPAANPPAKQPQKTPEKAPVTQTAADDEPASAPPPAATTTTGNATPAEPQQSQPARQETPPAPARPAVQRGQMVEPGTQGLVDPQMISLKRVAYPPLARRNKVEGLVIVRALISEDGKVLETELLRGVSQNVGLNEAAMEMVRGGSFKAGTLENVPVRAWKTIPIPFKME